MKNELIQCEVCLYLIIAAFVSLLLAGVTPLIDREIVRGIMGLVTVIMSIIGMSACAYIGYFLAKDHTELGRRLISVYVMTGFVLLCTGGMGLAGALFAPVYVWDFIYNTRGLAITLEVVALLRFLYSWVRIGRE